MHLLLVNYEYPPVGGGAATATHALGRRFARMGHRVTVLASGVGEEVGTAQEEGVRIVRLATGRARADRASPREMLAFVRRAWREAPRLARHESFDAALVFFAIPCGPIGWMLRSRHGIPYVLSLRGGDVPGFLPELGWQHALLAPVRRRCVRAAHAVVANSESLARLARAADGGEVRVIPNGVDTELFAPATAVRGDDVVRYLFVGRLTGQKRLDLALTALRRLQQAHGDASGFRLVVVGDGPLRGALEREAAALGLAGAVEWKGWVARERMADAYRASDCLLLPSSAEGMSNAVLEAMACGLPVIASHGPGNRDFVVNRQHGYSFGVGDVGGLYQAMLAVQADPAQRRRFGASNRAWVLEHHSWQASAEAYLALMRAAPPPRRSG